MKSSGLERIVFLIACLALLGSCKKQTKQADNNDYKTITVSPSTATLTKEYTATLEGEQNVEIRPQVSGTITKICVKEGADVNKGQVMFVIDQIPYKASLANAVAEVNSAKASVASARLTLKSKKELKQQKVVSDYDVEQAQNSLNSAIAVLQNAQASEISARNNFSYTIVKSPADGVIGMINYRVGALVNSSITDPLTIVSDNKRVYAYFSITEREMQNYISKYGSLKAALNKMQRVKLKLSDGTNYAITGKVDAISGNVDSTTGTVTLRASFTNLQSMLRNGGTGIITLPYTVKNSIVIPQGATYELQDKIFVYKVVNGKTKSSIIKVMDFNDGTHYVVTSGLQSGDVIIAEGAGLLKDGIKVKK